MLKRCFYFFAAILALAGLRSTPDVVAQGPTFVNIYNLDAEYELDRLMGEFPWEERDPFVSTSTGFRITTGSLNIRHFYIEETLKTRFPLIDDKFWLRFQYRKRQGLERNEVDVPLELEVRLRPRWFLSLVGEPAFHKSDTDVGAALRWGETEGRSLKFTYLWPDFDTNYAFRNQSVNEDHQEFYRRLPQEARLSAVWIEGPWSLNAGGTFSRPSELVRQGLIAPFTRYILKGSRSEGSLDLRRRWAEWTWGLESEFWRERQSIDFEPVAPSSDRGQIQERSTVRSSLERRLAPDWRLRFGGGLAFYRSHMRYPAQPNLNESNQIDDRLGTLSLFHELRSGLWLEGGYIADRQWFKVQGPGFVQDMGRRVHKRGKVALQYHFSERSYIRAVAALELDRAETEHFLSFDGGTVQLQTVF
ncbi:MAG: hypothetical protein HY548_03535 [Elusimicrobia bacterium]|nr:hypothetical protein [Elusimicrobiota bacterium]